MNLDTLRSEVVNLIDDDSYSNEILDRWINRCVQYAAGLVNLPDLKRIGSATVGTSVPYFNLATLTDGFSGRLLRVSSSSGNKINIYPTLEMLYDAYIGTDNTEMTKAGVVEAVALEGNILWFQYVPATEETLFIIYYENPARLSLSTDEPDDFPEHLHRKLFVHGTASIVFDEIEDGIDGKKVNSEAQHWQAFDENNKHSGITLLRSYVAARRVHHINSTWNY